MEARESRLMKEKLIRELQKLDSEKGRQWLLRKTGMPRSHMSSIVNEKKPVSVEKLEKLLSQCGVEISLSFKKIDKSS